MSTRPCVCVLYRWKLHPGRESAFVTAWSGITAALREDGGSLGSRLHRGSDGLWYGYAQWPDEGTRERAFAAAVNPALRASMRAAIEESYPEVMLEIAADF